MGSILKFAQNVVGSVFRYALPLYNDFDHSLVIIKLLPLEGGRGSKLFFFFLECCGKSKKYIKFFSHCTAFDKGGGVSKLCMSISPRVFALSQDQIKLG